MWHPDNQLRKKLNFFMLLQADKNNFARINKNTKYVLAI